jgi:hypothetical protein
MPLRTIDQAVLVKSTDNSGNSCNMRALIKTPRWATNAGFFLLSNRGEVAAIGVCAWPNISVTLQAALKLSENRL